MIGRLVALGLRPAEVAVAEGRRAERWARGQVTDAASAATVSAFDAVLASRAVEELVTRVLASDLLERVITRADEAGFTQRVADRLLADGAAERVAVRVLEGPELNQIVARVVQSPATEQLLARVIDSRLLGDAIAGLLEREELWTLVEEVARSPAVTSAIAQQSVGFAGEVAGQVRTRSDRADDWLERRARGLFRRRPSDPGPKPGPGEAGPA